jgi:hypothetical protein
MLQNPPVKLRKLDLSSNALARFPRDIAKLPLQTLCLDVNQFTRIPFDLASSPALVELSMKYNRIGQIPPTVFRCGKLWPCLPELDLSHNPIGRRPSSLADLKALKKVLVAPPPRGGLWWVPDEFVFNNNLYLCLDRNIHHHLRRRIDRRGGSRFAARLAEFPPEAPNALHVHALRRLADA